MGRVSVDQSAAAVLELSVLSDGQFGGVGGRQAVVEGGGAVTLLHLRQRRHQPRVRRIQRADPLLLIGQRQKGGGTGSQTDRYEGESWVCVCRSVGLKPHHQSFLHKV